MSTRPWKASPALGVRNVRQAAETYRDVLGFDLHPDDGVFQPSSDDPGGVYVYMDDLEALHADLLRRGAAIEQGPQVWPPKAFASSKSLT